VLQIRGKDRQSPLILEIVNIANMHLGSTDLKSLMKVGLYHSYEVMQVGSRDDNKQPPVINHPTSIRSALSGLLP
jgi:hypothetical protein